MFRFLFNWQPLLPLHWECYAVLLTLTLGNPPSLESIKNCPAVRIKWGWPVWCSRSANAKWCLPKQLAEGLCSCACVHFPCCLSMLSCSKLSSDFFDCTSGKATVELKEYWFLWRCSGHPGLSGNWIRAGLIANCVLLYVAYIMYELIARTSTIFIYIIGIYLALLACTRYIYIIMQISLLTCESAGHRLESRSDLWFSRRFSGIPPV